MANIPNIFKELLNGQHFTDVTLVTEDDHKIEAHKVILSSCSPIFKNILLNNSHINPVIYLNDVNYKELEMIMKFIYIGQCDVEKEYLKTFLEAGKHLKMYGLEEFIDVNIAEESVFDKEPLHNEKQIEQKHDEICNVFEAIDHNTSTVKEENNYNLSFNQDSIKIFSCNKCPEIFGTYIELYLHNPKKCEGQFKCNQCDYQVNKEKKMSQHNRSSHQGGKYTCDMCDYESYSSSKLVMHKKTKHEGLKFMCEQCGYNVVRKEGLKLHIQSKHEGMRYECDQCNKRYINESDLTKHKQFKHTV